jgi:phage N-6-adenine-methyltransferase
MSPRPEWWTSDDWSTPQAYFDKVAARLGPFDLDACCRTETAKASDFYTKEDDGLANDWYGRVWVNPPYSKPKVWCQKAVEETKSGNASMVVMLLPAAVDTHWFHDWVLPFAQVEFIRGRIRFIGWEGTPIGSPKSGNILAIYTAETIRAHTS